MGKIIMPKNSALLNEIQAVLKIYYEHDDWMKNSEYKEKLKILIGADQYSSSYTKKAQITSYFGFTEWEDITNVQSLRRITDSGRQMYEALDKNDEELVREILMNSLEKVKFGRDNFGCPDSDSDVEPPNLFIRSILDLNYLTYKEFAYLLWKLEDKGGNYTDVIKELKKYRSDGNLILDSEAIKYTDCKPIMILVRWGFLSEAETESREKHIIINHDVEKAFFNRLRNLKIYNIDKDVAINEQLEEVEDKNITLNENANKIIKPFCINSLNREEITSDSLLIETSEVKRQNINGDDKVIFLDIQMENLLVNYVYKIISIEEEDNYTNMKIIKCQLINKDRKQDIINKFKMGEE